MDDTITQSAVIIERLALDWAMSDASLGLSHTAFRLLLILARRCDKYNCSCFPGRKRLLADTGMSESTLRVAFESLTGYGVLTIEPRYGDEGRQKSNLYVLSFPTTPVKSTTPSKITGGEGTEIQRGGGCRESVPRTESEGTESEGTDWGDVAKEFSTREKKEKVAPKPSEPRIQWKAIKEAWNEMAEECNLDEIMDISSDRLKSARARIRKHGIDKFMQVIHAPRESRLLRGEVASNDGRPSWRPTFDWFIKESNFVKTLEGKYRDREESGTVGHHAI